MYTFNTKVSYSRVDKNGQVPLHEIMNYMQDCSTFQSEVFGDGVKNMEAKGKAWIIIAYKIRINKPIYFGQDICVGTAPTEFGRLYASRKFFIKDSNGEYLVQADSIWVLINLENRGPVRITAEDTKAYIDDAEEGFENLKASKKLNFTGEKQKCSEFTVKKTYIDSNGHMNNADYLRAAEEFLPEDCRCRELDVVYIKEALQGEKITPYMYAENDGIGIVFESSSGEVLTKIKINK